MRYVLKRLGQAVIVLWGAITLAFLVVQLVPGDPVKLMLGVGSGGESSGVSDPAAEAALREQLGLDKPLVVQYVEFVGHAVTLRFGTSYSTRLPVIDSITAALPATLQLGAVAIVLALVLALLFSLGATLFPTRALRSLTSTVSVLGTAVPSFWVGIIALQIFSFGLGLFPAYGNEGVASLVLPAFTLALLSCGTIAQVLTRGIRESLAEPYTDTLRAKGLGTARIVLTHSLRNASLPVLTMVGMMVGGLLSGTTIVETVFGRTGLGSLAVTAVRARDFPMIQALIVLSGGLFVIVTLIVDLLYRKVDPRVVAEEEVAA